MAEALPSPDAPAREDSRFQSAREIFHADRDLSGDWHVWRRMGLSSWATYRRCNSQEEAERLAAELNHQYRVEI